MCQCVTVATTSRLKFKDPKEEPEKEVGMEVEGNFAAMEEGKVKEEVIDSNNTIADYYFDSYSHFGVMK
ncbi:hypothetical protein GUJ93_ZPchr0002g25662 [Zizania palustris]|uniref:Uncharacterized protein n=1 Tax=Zizania palustris TaxID=103762 RepID=A0A8J5SF14_ZIZPA|nr:hypothetical protein GUJ93_ZPchr0002g25662 [Zizania palustris]